MECQEGQEDRLKGREGQEDRLEGREGRKRQDLEEGHRETELWQKR